jgi:acyl-CoA thioester hydrolase
MTPHPLLRDFPIILELPVQWGEMDAYGHVNNTVFFRYFESARMMLLERVGLVESHASDQIGAILHSTNCRFRLPLHYPDTVQVGTRASDIKDDRFTMEYVIVSLGQNQVAAEGSAIVVSFNYSAGKKAPLPVNIVSSIRNLTS